MHDNISSGNDYLSTDTEIIALHKKYAPSKELFNAVYIHCLTVWRIAEQVAVSGRNIDKELVKRG
jgi:uncharacterized protein